MSTPFVLDDETQYEDGRVVGRPDARIMNIKMTKMACEYQDILDGIPHQDIYTSAQLKERLLAEIRLQGGMTYADFCSQYISEIESEGRHSYASLLERSGRYFVESVGNVPLSDITPQLITMFANRLRSRRSARGGRLSHTTVNMMLSQVKAVINRAIAMQMVRYDVHPFLGVKIQRPPVRNLEMSIDEFARFRSAVPCGRKQAISKDVFLLSFYLGGINLVDLIRIDFRGREATYVRTKTRNRTSEVRRVTIPILSQAREIAEKYMNKDGLLDFGYEFSYHNLSVYLSRGIKELGASIGMDGVIYYSARHTFAQFAYDLGIPDGIVDYCLGHSDSSRGVIRHYSKANARGAATAMAKVADYVDNPGKYEIW